MSQSSGPTAAVRKEQEEWEFVNVKKTQAQLQSRPTNIEAMSLNEKAQLHPRLKSRIFDDVFDLKTLKTMIEDITKDLLNRRDKIRHLEQCWQTSRRNYHDQVHETKKVEEENLVLKQELNGHMIDANEKANLVATWEEKFETREKEVQEEMAKLTTTLSSLRDALDQKELVIDGMKRQTRIVQSEIVRLGGDIEANLRIVQEMVEDMKSPEKA